MANKYRKNLPDKRVSPSALGKKLGIGVIVALSVIILTLIVLLILDKTGILYNGQAPENDEIIPPVRADDEIHSDGIYSYAMLTDGTVMVIGCDPEDGVTEISVPDTLGGYRVSAIGESCFALLTDLKLLTLPEGVEYCGKNMVYGVLNIRMYLPSTLTQIENNAFAGCEAPDGIYFNGTKEDWAEVKIGEGNSVLDRVSFLK